MNDRENGVSVGQDQNSRGDNEGDDEEDDLFVRRKRKKNPEAEGICPCL